jgi:hypothetical protein
MQVLKIVQFPLSRFNSSLLAIGVMLAIGSAPGKANALSEDSAGVSEESIADAAEEPRQTGRIVVRHPCTSPAGRSSRHRDRHH